MEYSVSILLPVVNETYSLKQTVDIIAASCSEFVKEYIIITCKKTIPESRKTISELQHFYGSKILLLEQSLPFLGGAVRDAFDICRGTHVIMMASDLETDPNLVAQLISESKKQPDCIITSSRWIGEGFQGYNMFKLGLNYIFQKFFSFLYQTDLTDMTYGFRILPVKLVQSIVWKELRHQFLFETILKPLRLGIKVMEIPTHWIARVEGESQNPFFRNFAYFKTGMSIRFQNKSKILKTAGIK